MKRRVLAMVMALAMIFSLLPAGAGAAASDAEGAAFIFTVQQAHNQAVEDQLDVEIYLQADTAGREVTGFQFTLEGLKVIQITDALGNGALQANGETIVYSPENTAFTVGTSRVLVATVSFLVGDNGVSALTEALRVTDCAVSMESAEPTAEAVVLDFAEDNHGDAAWEPLSSDTDLTKAGTYHYYLTGDLEKTGNLLLTGSSDTGTARNIVICLNGYTISTTSRAFFLQSADYHVTVCDCTAHHDADGQYTAGRIIPTGTWGGAVSVRGGASVTMTNGIIDGTGSTCSGDAAAVYVTSRSGDGAAGTFTMTGGQIVNCTATGSGSAVYLAAGTVNLRNAVIKNCTGRNSSSIYALAGNLTVGGSTVIDNHVYLKESGVLSLDALASDASLTLSTYEDKDAGSINDVLTMVSGGLTEGCLLYGNTGKQVLYDPETEAFCFVLHTCASNTDRAAWTDSTSLPAEAGTYCLETDVTLEEPWTVSAQIQLCLNGHTITQTGDARVINVQAAGKLAIYDCAEGHDAQGNLTGGLITGGDNTIGSCVWIERGGGVFSLYGGRISGNASSSTDANYGSAVYLQSSQPNKSGGVFNMYGGEIRGNGSETTIGGAVYVAGETASSGNRGTRPAVFNMYGGTLADNTSKYGGAICAVQDAVVNIQGGTVSGNTGATGSAIDARQDAVLNISKAVITGNTAATTGAVYAQNNVQITVTDSQITGNTSAGTNGVHAAGIYMTGDGSRLTVSGAVVIDSNTAASGAPDVCLANSNTDTLYVKELKEGSRVTFKTPQTSAVEASDIIALAEGGTQTDVWQSGWVTYIDSAGTEKKVGYTAQGFTFGHCHGGQLYTAWTGTETGTHVYLTEDVQLESSWNCDRDVTVCLNGFDMAGAEGCRVVTLSNGCTLTVEDCTAHTDEDGAYISGGITGGSADSGGAVYVGSGSVFQMSGGKLYGNTASKDGGAVYAEGGTVRISGGVFEGNTAENGGAVYIIAGGTSNIENTTFQNNTAVNGGAVYTTAVKDDGGSVTYVNMNITDCSFSGNQASSAAGAILSWGTKTVIGNTSISGNTGANGSAVTWFGGSLTLDDVSIEGNNATNSYGALHLNNSSAFGGITVTVKGKTRVINNTAKSTDSQNLFMRDSASFITVGELESEAMIGVTFESGRFTSERFAFTTELDGYDPSAYFVSDSADYGIINTGDTLCLAAAEDIQEETWDLNSDGKVDVHDAQYVIDNSLTDITVQDVVDQILGGGDELSANEDGVWEIWSVMGLRHMTENPDLNYMLMADIDLEGAVWTPVAGFSGSFDGNGHTIRNYRITASVNNSTGNTAEQNMGFFGDSTKGSEIKDLHLADFEIRATDTQAQFIGGLIGTDRGTVSGCTVSGAIYDTRTATSAGSVIYRGFAAGRIASGSGGTVTMGTVAVQAADGVGAEVEVAADMLLSLADGVTMDFVGWGDDDTTQGLWRDRSSSTSLQSDTLQERRQTAIDYMRAMGTVKWTPSNDFVDYVNNTVQYTYLVGTTYTGLPYNHSAGSLQRFLSQMGFADESGVYTTFEQEDGYYYTGTAATEAGVSSKYVTGYSLYMGNDCSSSVGWSWRQVSSVDISEGGAYAYYSTYMVPNEKNQSTYGIYPVGDYTTGTYTTTSQIQVNNDPETILEAYTSARMGDAIVRYGQLSNGTTGGHVRMLSYDPVVIRDSSGDIDADKSYMITIEQGAAATNSSWRVDYEYSFTKLLAYSADSTEGSGYCYVPVTIRALNTEDTAAATPQVTLSGSTVSSNFSIISTTVDGNEVFTAVSNKASEYRIKATSVDLAEAHGLSAGTYTAAVLLSNGTTQEVAICVHSYADGTCTFCGEACVHSWSSGSCTKCGMTCAHPSHSTGGICSTCGSTVVHSHTAVVTAPTCTEQGYTTYTCGTCGDSYVDDYVDATGHSYENGSCSVCGEADPNATQRFTLAGSNMVLGGVLDMNFFINQTDISGTDYYAEITHYAQSGTKVTNVPYSEWGTYGTFYMLTLEGLEARQMADKIEVVIYSTDGTQVSETWTDSIRDYSMRTYEARNEKGKTLLVDMLNYGAAAQTFFGYNASDLANNQLTEEQLAYATDSVSCTDQRVQGDNYFGSTLVLESRIILTLLFKDVTTDMYAVVTYTDHYGVTQEITVQGSEFSQYYSYYGVMVDELVVADGDQLVTVTVYNADGTVFGSATDSMNSYAARKLESDPIYEMVAKFTASAYAYFH